MVLKFDVTEVSMRIQLTFRPSQGKLVLPINYEEIMQGFLYRSIQDLELASFLHNRGFLVDKRQFKLFTFSRLFGKFNLNREKKQIEFVDRIYWHVSSVLDDLIIDLGQNFLQKEQVTIYGQPVLIEETSVRHLQVEEKEAYRIKMLSPLTVYHTYENRSGEKRTQYYSPFDFSFSDMVEKNFVNKYRAYYDREPEGRLHINPVSVSRKNKVVTLFKNTRINAWSGIYELVCPYEHLRFLYDTGLGAKNSQGFGMFEVIEEKGSSEKKN